MSDNDDDNDEIVWQCKCGLVMPNTQYLSFRFDVGCPRCRRSLADFTSRKWTDLWGGGT